MSRKNEIRAVWVKGFIDKDGNIIIPINNDGALHRIQASSKNETVWKYDEDVEE